jgi:hypothetical protein
MSELPTPEQQELVLELGSLLSFILIHSSSVEDSEFCQLLMDKTGVPPIFSDED